MPDIKELNENELEKITGGHGDTMKADCPFCNNGSYVICSGRSLPSSGENLGGCGYGHKAVYIGGFYMTVEWTNSEGETKTSNFHS